MKKVLALTLACVFVIFALASCGSKTALTKEEFIKKAEESGIQTIKLSYMESSIVESSTTAYVAEGSTMKWQSDFIILTDESYAKGLFETKRSHFEDSINGSFSSSSANLGNYNTYELTAHGEYMYVSRVDNTLLSVRVDEEYKDAVKEFIGKLGY